MPKPKAKLRPLPKKHYHPIPPLVACEVEGRTGYWRAIHSNGLVQTVQGPRTEAERKVRVVVARLNAFEVWCRTPNAGINRIKLL